MGDKTDYSLSLDILHFVNRQQGFRTLLKLSHLQFVSENNLLALE